jgi:deoxyribodipyrimidine photo-lyase
MDKNRDLTTSLVWIRNDFRISDNSALLHALDSGMHVIIAHVLEDNFLGTASRQWQNSALHSFKVDLKSLGHELVITSDSIVDLVQRHKCKVVFWNRRYEPHLVAVDRQVEKELVSRGIEVKTFQGNLLFEPDSITTKSGTPFTIFTPFYNSLSKFTPDHPKEVFKTNHQSPLLYGWEPTERAALHLLKEFCLHKDDSYEHDRDFPALDGTSRLSPYLHFGQISARFIWHHTSSEVYRKELIWREFAHHSLHYHPKMDKEPIRKEFKNFPWRYDKDDLQAWQQGRTGYPIVDAGMRQLLQTGWMHNRVRMIVGSFLVKHLTLPWQEGYNWFWEHLVDADLANNSLGWQWVAGCGGDAAPYFRVFNPVLQGQKFDPEGEYVRRFVPELKDVPNKLIHTPWLAGTACKNYPEPIIDVKEGRDRALAAFQKMRQKS